MAIQKVLNDTVNQALWEEKYRPSTFWASIQFNTARLASTCRINI